MSNSTRKSITDNETRRDHSVRESDLDRNSRGDQRSDQGSRQMENNPRRPQDNRNEPSDLE